MSRSPNASNGVVAVTPEPPPELSESDDDEGGGGGDKAVVAVALELKSRWSLRNWRKRRCTFRASEMARLACDTRLVRNNMVAVVARSCGTSATNGLMAAKSCVARDDSSAAVTMSNDTCVRWRHVRSSSKRMRSAVGAAAAVVVPALAVSFARVRTCASAVSNA